MPQARLATKAMMRTAAAGLVLAAAAAAFAALHIRSQQAIDGIQVVSAAELSAEHAERALEGVNLRLRALAEQIEAAWQDGTRPGPRLQPALNGVVGALPQIRAVHLVDAEGRPTTDPNQVKALLPFAAALGTPGITVSPGLTEKSTDPEATIEESRGRSRDRRGRLTERE